MGKDLIQYRTLWVAVCATCSSLAAVSRSRGVEWMERVDVVLATRESWKSVRWASIFSESGYVVGIDKWSGY